MDEKRAAGRRPVFLRPSEGRQYLMGKITSIFKADSAESGGGYSISEWWMEPHTKGPGVHVHEHEDDVFYVIEGTMTFFVEDHWFDAEVGSFVLAPAGVKHDFENRSGQKAGMLNISVPGGFEEEMPAIVNWFEKYPPGEAEW